MKRILNLLVIIVLFCSMGCDDVKGASARDILTDVVVDIQLESGDRCALTLNADGAASMRCQMTMCCWDIYYGSHTYKKQDDNTWIISVSYTSREEYNTTLVDTVTIDFNVDHILKFTDDWSGSYSESSENDFNDSGLFWVNEIQ